MPDRDCGKKSVYGKESGTGSPVSVVDCLWEVWHNSINSVAAFSFFPVLQSRCGQEEGAPSLVDHGSRRKVEIGKTQ